MNVSGIIPPLAVVPRLPLNAVAYLPEMFIFILQMNELMNVIMQQSMLSKKIQLQ